MSRRARATRSALHARGVPFWVAAGLGLSASGALGCLADPPTFAPRGQVPPFIIAGQVDPPLGSIYEEANIDINVPFRSEDVNIDLSATLYLDLVPGAPGVLPQSVLRSDEVAAGNYEVLRWVSMPGVGVPGDGCHNLTLIMTYVDNLARTRGYLPLDEDRAARVVWWLNIDDGDGETRMADCPGASQVDAVPSDR